MRWILGAVCLSIAFGEDLSPLEKERSVWNVVELHESAKVVGQILGEEMTHAKQLRIAGTDGKGFVCFRRRSEEEKVEDESSSGSEEDEKVSEIQRQLQSLKGSCFQKRAGYWTYKVCPFDRVDQVHYEGNLEQLSFHLGSFVAFETPSIEDDKVLKNEKQLKQQDDSSDSEWIQRFSGGTNGRESNVVFSCNPDVALVDVVSVEEVELHKYKIHVETHLACHASPEWQAKQLLAPLRSQCFRRTESWWTYEVCHERHIRQFHKEKDGRMTEFLLGEFDTRENDEIERHKQLLTKDKHTGRATLQQKYTGGTPCDLKEVHRSSTVLYMCNLQQLDASESINLEPTGIIGITESPSCNYIIKVHTPLLCAHPFFKAGLTSRKKSEVSKILCAPADTYLPA